MNGRGLACVVVVLLGGSAYGQELAGPPLASPAVAMQVLQTPAAQQELRLDRKQVRVVGNLSKQWAKVTGVSGRAGAEALRKANGEVDRTVRESLSESQLRRLEQLVVQLPVGPEMFVRPRMVEQLQLEGAQVQLMQQMQQQLQLGLEQLRFRGLDQRQLAEARYAMIQQVQNEAAANVLTDGQRALMIDLTGPRFDWIGVLMPWRNRVANGP